MKNLLITLCLIFSIFTATSQKIYCHPFTPGQECISIYLVAKSHLKDTNVTIIYQPYDPLFQGFNGVTWQYNHGLYLINLSAFVTDDMERMWALLHEMGHVIDMYNGDLKQFPLEWKGKRVFEKNIPWDQRPWEQSAENWAKVLWKELFGVDPPAYLIEMHGNWYKFKE